MHSKIMGLTLLFIFSCGTCQFLIADTIADWTTLNHINVARDFAATFYYNGYLYLVGDGSGTTARTIERIQIYPYSALSPWTIDTLFSSMHGYFRHISMVKGYIYAREGTPEYGPINLDGTVGHFFPSLALDTER